MVRLIKEDFWDDLAAERQSNLDKANKEIDDKYNNLKIDKNNYDEVDLKTVQGNVYNDPAGEKILKYMTFKLQKAGFKVNSNYDEDPEEIRSVLNNINSKTGNNIEEQNFNSFLMGYLPLKQNLYFNDNKKYKNGLYRIYLNINLFIKSFLVENGSDKCKIIIQTNVLSFTQDELDKYQQLYNECMNQIYEIIKQGRNQSNWEIEEQNIFSIQDDLFYIGDKDNKTNTNTNVNKINRQPDQNRMTKGTRQKKDRGAIRRHRNQM